MPWRVETTSSGKYVTDGRFIVMISTSKAGEDALAAALNETESLRAERDAATLKLTLSQSETAEAWAIVLGERGHVNALNAMYQEAVVERDALRKRVRELEGMLTREGHEFGCTERYPAKECLCHRLSGRGETDGATDETQEDGR